jgi:ribosomal-protein-alanine N-acetyltransferase
MTQVRPASVTDAPLMAALHAAGGGDRPWGAGEYQTLLARPQTLAWVAMTADGAAGFLIATLMADEAEIYEVVVAPAHRRRGLGRALMTALATQAKAAGARKIHLEVATNNPAARALYEGCGYQAVGRRKGYYKYSNGDTADAILMTLAIQEL